MVGRSCDSTLVRQPGQEGLDLGATQPGGMASTVIVGVRPNSMDIGLLGPYAVVQVPDALAQSVEDRERLQWQERVVLVFVTAVSTYGICPVKQGCKPHPPGSGAPVMAERSGDVTRQNFRQRTKLGVMDA